MLGKGKKNAGRGDTREAWIKHHQGIVERVERQKKESEGLHAGSNNSEETLEQSHSGRHTTNVEVPMGKMTTGQFGHGEVDSQREVSTEDTDQSKRSTTTDGSVTGCPEKKISSSTFLQKSSTTNTSTDERLGKVHNPSYTDDKQDVTVRYDNKDQVDSFYGSKRTKDDTRRSLQQRIARLKTNQGPRAGKSLVKVKKELVDVVMTEVNMGVCDDEGIDDRSETTSVQSDCETGTNQESTMEDSNNSISDNSSEISQLDASVVDGNGWEEDMSWGSNDEMPVTQRQTQREENNVAIKRKLPTPQFSEKHKKTQIIAQQGGPTRNFPSFQQHGSTEIWSEVNRGSEVDLPSQYKEGPFPQGEKNSSLVRKETDRGESHAAPQTDKTPTEAGHNTKRSNIGESNIALESKGLTKEKFKVASQESVKPMETDTNSHEFDNGGTNVDLDEDKVNRKTSHHESKTGTGVSESESFVRSSHQARSDKSVGVSRTSTTPMETGNKVRLSSIGGNNTRAMDRVDSTGTKSQATLGVSSMEIGATNSDDEWAAIAAKTRNINRNDYSRYNRSYQAGRKKTFISTNTTGNVDDSVHNRGLYLTENKELLSTPISIEFNISAGTNEFNIIRESRVVFDAMSEIDSTIRVYGSTNKEVLWELNGSLPEDDNFRTLFGMREQHFRKGNSKVTIYCTVESCYPINKIKFTDPLKSVLYENNIWLKPDFYSTKIVSSPGFFTLLHPRLTNKEFLVKNIQRSLQSTKLDDEEPIVREWNQRTRNDLGKEQSIPQFHIETTLKKWGPLQVEVLSIHCAIEDSKYVKYLFATASTQSTFQHGVYVPAGIHLLEGKEVLTHLLTEHQTFVQTTTSFQIEGISLEEMDHTEENQPTIRELLINANGVHTIEQTYQTIRKGQWLLVVDKEKVQSLAQYIKQNAVKIYRNKKGTLPKLVTHQVDKGLHGYKMQMTDSVMHTVGTYAEVLTRRFSSIPKSNSMGLMGKSGPGTTSDVYRAASKQGTTVFKTGLDNNTNHLGSNGFLSKDHSAERNINIPRPGKGSTQSGKSTYASKPGTETHIRQKFPNDTAESDSKHETVPMGNNKLDTLAKIIHDKMDLFESNNQKLFQELETRIEDKLDQIMENKLIDISVVVGNRVTHRLIKAMGQMLKKHRDSNEGVISDSTSVTQDISTPTPQSNHHKPDGKEVHETKTRVSTTNQMLTELESIKKMIFPTADPPHDNSIGSVEGTL